MKEWVLVSNVCTKGEKKEGIFYQGIILPDINTFDGDGSRPSPNVFCGRNQQKN